MHYLYRKEDGSYIGAFDDEAMVLVVESYNEGPAPATARDKFINDEFIPYTGVLDKKKAIQDAIGSLPIEKLTPLLPVIAQGAPFMDAGRWDVVAVIADSVPQDDPDVKNVIELVKSLADV
jgi:hypothetical protein